MRRVSFLFLLSLLGLKNANAQAPSFSYPAAPNIVITGSPISPISPNGTGGTVPALIYGRVTTMAGNGTSTAADGTGTAAGLPFPVGIAFDAAKNLYVTNWKPNGIPYLYNYIRKITPAGVVTTYAGTGNQGYTNGPALSAQFDVPTGTAVDGAGNVYVADVNNNVIRKITPGGVVSTFAGSGQRGKDDGINTEAKFSSPTNVAIDFSGNLYVTDYSNNLIRKITPAGTVSTLAGGGPGSQTNGTGANASFKNPEGITVDNAGNIYVADGGNNSIRKITPGGTVTTVAGSGSPGFADGAALSAQFHHPTGVAIDLAGNLYVADAGNNTVRKISSAGIVTTLAGQPTSGNADGVGAAAKFYNPYGVTIDADGYLYIADRENNLLRKVAYAGYTISPALPAGLNFDGTSGIITGVPTAISPLKQYTVTAYNAYGSSTATVSIGVTGSNLPQTSPPQISYATPQVYKVNLTIPPLSPANTGGAVPNELYGGTTIFAGSGIPGASDNTGALATFATPFGVAADRSGNVYVSDAGNNLVRKITPAGVVTTLTAAGTFNQPAGIAVDKTGDIYVADGGNNVVRRITAGGAVSIVASGLNNPKGVVVDGGGNIYVTDASNTIKKITPSLAMSTFAGSGGIGSANGAGSAASFNNPAGLAIDKAGYIYVADVGNNLIRKITPGGLVSTVAGGTRGSADGIGASASFNVPLGLTVDAIGNIYIADSDNQLIRKITPDGTVTTLAGKAGVTGRANGQGADATFNRPTGVAADADGNVYVADYVNNLIRKVTTNGYTINKPLPAGLSFDGKTGTISGTPTAQSPSTDYLITAYNTGGSSSFTVNITVQPPRIEIVPPPDISYVTPQNYVINRAIIPLQPANSGGPVPQTVYGQVTTFAGNGTSGTADGAGATARFRKLSAIATDLVGNVYFVDENRIRKVSPAGAVTTLAGSTAAGSVDGTGASAQFDHPLGLAVDVNGNIFVADTKNNTIRMVTQAGEVRTIAGNPGVTGRANGTGAAASFNAPAGIAVDQDNNIYVADQGNHLIRKLNRSGAVSAFAGSGTPGSADGAGSAAFFNQPVSITADLDGNVYVADHGNNEVRKITPAGLVSTLAGSGATGAANGSGSAASFNDLHGIWADIAGNVYVADAGNHLIRKITPNGTVSTLAGNGSAGATNGNLTAASFNYPSGVAADITGNVYVADMNNNIARKITTTGYSISSALPPGLTFNAETGTISGKPTALWSTTVYTITAYNTGGSSATQLSITVSDQPVPVVPPPNISYTQNNTFTLGLPVTPLAPVNTGGPFPDKIFGQTTTLAGSGSPGSANGIGLAASFNQPFGVATDKSGVIYVVDHLNNLIRKITKAGEVSVFAGSGQIGSADGVGTAASFNNPTGIAVDIAGNVYVADVSNNLVRKITPAGVVTTLAGNIGGGFADGQGTAASFSNPTGLAVDNAGNIYVADQINNRIRKITPGGFVTTLAGNGISGALNGVGTQATFHSPQGVTVDADGVVYVADASNNAIRKILPDGTVSTLAGNGTSGSTDGMGAAATFSDPFNLTVDENGYIYVVDTQNELIRKITPEGYVTTVAGNGTRGNENGTGSQSSFYQPTGIISDGAGNVYIADEFNHQIRQVVVVSNFTIDKELPKGMSFNPTTGVISGTPTVESPPTDYTVTAYNQGGKSSYTIQIVINRAPPIAQTITFGPLAGHTYGDAPVALIATSSNSTLPIVYSSSNTNIADVTSGQVHFKGAGTVTITATQPGNGVFSDAAPVSQQLTITPAALTIKADDKTKKYTSPNPIFTATYTGFVYNDNAANLTIRPIFTTTADSNSPVGDYPITPANASSPNYTFTYLPGTLTIEPIPPTVSIPNAFTPNGDGINDNWVIESLVYYTNCTVSVFNRYGALMYQSNGYPQPWNGTSNRNTLPAGTYYYIINLRNGKPQMSGSVTIIK